MGTLPGGSGRLTTGSLGSRTASAPRTSRQRFFAPRALVPERRAAARGFLALFSALLVTEAGDLAASILAPRDPNSDVTALAHCGQSKRSRVPREPFGAPYTPHSSAGPGCSWLQASQRVRSSTINSPLLPQRPVH